MNTLEAFEANKEALRGALQSADSLTDCQIAIQMAFEKMGALLAQNETDEVTRQREQAVLALAKQSASFLQCVRAEGKLIAEESTINTEQQKKANRNQICLYAGLGILCVLALFEIINGKWGFALLAVIATLLLYIGSDRKSPEPVIQWKAAAQPRIDVDATVREIEELCRSVDIAVMDLSMIDREHVVRESGTQEDALLDLMSTLMEARQSGREDLALESLNDVEQALYRLGITPVLYAPEVTGYFDVLPTMGESRTVRPALLDGDRLARRGVAAVKMQEAAR